MYKMELTCCELMEYLNMPPSDLEPANCMVNKLRAMSNKERGNVLMSMSYTDQLKLARTHKICTEVLNKSCCILAD